MPRVRSEGRAVVSVKSDAGTGAPVERHPRPSHNTATVLILLGFWARCPATDPPQHLHPPAITQRSRGTGARNRVATAGRLRRCAPFWGFSAHCPRGSL